MKRNTFQLICYIAGLLYLLPIPLWAGGEPVEQAINTSVLPDTHIDIGAADSEPLPFYRLAEDTYFLFGNIAQVDANNRGFNGNAGFIVSTKGVIVIDTLGTPKLGRRLIATIRSVTNRPITHVIITHSHPDHYYGASAFAALEGVQFVSHEGLLDYLSNETLESSVSFRKQILPEDMQVFKAVEPDLLVGGQIFHYERIESGNKSIELYNVGKHHSSGDLMVYQVEDKILWVSDLAFNQRVTFVGDGHSGHAIKALNWLEKRFSKVRLMVPGHGSAQTAPFPMLRKTRGYLETLRAILSGAFEADLDLETALDQIDLQEWTNIRLYQENHRRNASYIYREIEEELF